MTNPEDREQAPVTRRTMLRGAAVGGAALPLLAASGGGGAGASGAPGAGSSASGSASGSGGSSGGKAAIKVAAADVPVGGGTIIDQSVVVTQPAKGEFKAFSAICTHQGCPVGSVTGGEIVCPCHGSHFSIKDGSPVSGPAPSPLAAKKVSVSGGQVTVT